MLLSIVIKCTGILAVLYGCLTISEGWRTLIKFTTIFGAPTGWWGLNLHLLGSTTLGIGVGYMVIALSIVFAFLGFVMIEIKKRMKGCDSY